MGTQEPRISDEQAATIIEAVLELACRVRDEVGPGVAEAARGVLAAAGGDPIAAVTVSACLVRVDTPVDAWWADYAELPVIAVPPIVCSTPGCEHPPRSRFADLCARCYKRQWERAAGGPDRHGPRPGDRHRYREGAA